MSRFVDVARVKFGKPRHGASAPACEHLKTTCGSIDVFVRPLNDGKSCIFFFMFSNANYHFICLINVEHTFFQYKVLCDYIPDPLRCIFKISALCSQNTRIYTNSKLKWIMRRSKQDVGSISNFLAPITLAATGASTQMMMIERKWTLFKFMKMMYCILSRIIFIRLSLKAFFHTLIISSRYIKKHF